MAEGMEALVEEIIDTIRATDAWDDDVKKRIGDDIVESEVWKRREAELAEVRAEVREWLCGQCSIVYPGPPDGISSVICPSCSGVCGPRGRIELLLHERNNRNAIEAAAVSESKFWAERTTVERLLALCRDVAKNLAFVALDALELDGGQGQEDADLIRTSIERLKNVGDVADPEAAHG